ncbi:hypothetical protein ACU4GD_29300 [Cupriavidus basilensis]
MPVLLDTTASPPHDPRTLHHVCFPEARVPAAAPSTAARRALLALLACGAGQGWAQPAASPTVWRMATEYPASAMPGEGLATFAEEVKKRTAGAIEVKPSFDASAGVKSAQMPRR